MKHNGKSFGPVAILATLVLLSGCAHAPEYALNDRGTAPTSGARYRLVIPEGEPSMLPPAIEARLARNLKAIGLGATDKQPDMLLFASLARRPARTGSFTRENPGDTAEQPDWIDMPATRGRQVTSFALRFVNPATGAEIRTVKAQARHGRRDGDAVLAHLVDSAVAGKIYEAPSR